MGYWNIEQNDVTDASCTRHWHAVAAVPWLRCSDGTFITHDDAESWSAKLSFVRENGLAGAMAWGLSSDDDAHSMISLMAEKL